MRAVVVVEKGVVELNWLWLPTCVGMNANLQAEMEKVLQDKLRGTSIDEEGLDRAHAIVVEFLEEKFAGVKGLARYLDALKFLEA